MVPKSSKKIRKKTKEYADGLARDQAAARAQQAQQAQPVAPLPAVAVSAAAPVGQMRPPQVVSWQLEKVAGKDRMGHRLSLVGGDWNMTGLFFHI